MITFFATLFLVGQIIDALQTYKGVSAVGLKAEANPYMKWWMKKIGFWPAIAVSFLHGVVGWSIIFLCDSNPNFQFVVATFAVVHKTWTIGNNNAHLQFIAYEAERSN